MKLGFERADGCAKDCGRPLGDRLWWHAPECEAEHMQEVEALRTALAAEKAAREEAERERDAKQENDERFMVERDTARAERDAAFARLAVVEGALTRIRDEAHTITVAVDIARVALLPIARAALATPPAAPPATEAGRCVHRYFEAVAVVGGEPFMRCAACGVRWPT